MAYTNPIPRFSDTLPDSHTVPIHSFANTQQTVYGDSLNSTATSYYPYPCQDNHAPHPNAAPQYTDLNVIDEPSPLEGVHVYQHPAASPFTGYPESSQRTTTAYPPSGLFSSAEPPPYPPVVGHRLVDTALVNRRVRQASTEEEAWGDDTDTFEPHSPDPRYMSPYSAHFPHDVPPSPSPVSNTSESYSSDGSEEPGNTTAMHRMMTQFYCLPQPPLMVGTNTLEPAIMTFQLFASSLEPVADSDRENQLLLRSFYFSDKHVPYGEDTPPVLPSMFQQTFIIRGREARWSHHISENQLGRVTSPDSESDSSPSHPFGDPGSNFRLVTPIAKPSSSRMPKRSKMHQCDTCAKSFPRPSGLRTHMNSHTGSKPYKCSVPGCTKAFAVRSNAKRHLRTHGINPSTCDSSPPGSRFTVDFEEPVVTQVHDSGRRPTTIRWIPQSLATRTNVDWLTSPSSAGTEGSEETSTAYPVLQTPLPAVLPSQSDYESGDEERNSLVEAGRYPYHPSQYRGLPGPAPK